MIWRTMNNFSTNAVALVVSSTPYDENDYIRNFPEFKKFDQNSRIGMLLLNNTKSKKLAV